MTIYKSNGIDTFVERDGVWVELATTLKGLFGPIKIKGITYIDGWMYFLTNEPGRAAQ